MININDLIKSKEIIYEKKIKLYNQTLLNCHEMIKKESKFNTSCIYQIYEYSPFTGIFYFNLQECLIYLIKKLQANGFDIIIMEKNKIYISWEKYVSDLTTEFQLPKNNKVKQIEQKPYEIENKIEEDIKRPNLNEKYFQEREIMEQKIKNRINIKQELKPKQEERKKQRIIFK